MQMKILRVPRLRDAAAFERECGEWHPGSPPGGGVRVEPGSVSTAGRRARSVHAACVGRSTWPSAGSCGQRGRWGGRPDRRPRASALGSAAPGGKGSRRLPGRVRDLVVAVGVCAVRRSECGSASRSQKDRARVRLRGVAVTPAASPWRWCVASPGPSSRPGGRHEPGFVRLVRGRKTRRRRRPVARDARSVESRCRRARFLTGAVSRTGTADQSQGHLLGAAQSMTAGQRPRVALPGGRNRWGCCAQG